LPAMLARRVWPGSPPPGFGTEAMSPRV
jgi:hypothetical protein